jgi:F-type H+-transporting ATPase subunit b
MHIDFWTLALQTLNVLVLVWLLQHFLYRPVRAAIAARQAAADSLLADAAATRDKAQAETAALASARDGLTAEGARIVAEARAAAEAEHAGMLHQATEAAARLQAEAAQANARDREVMRTALEREAGELAITIAERLLQYVPPQALTRAFMQQLAETIATDPAHAALAVEPVELRSATPLDAAAQAECREVLARAVGAPPTLVFQTDPGLIAGIELISPHVSIRHSWRADLERIDSNLGPGVAAHGQTSDSQTSDSQTLSTGTLDTQTLDATHAPLPQQVA